MEIQKVSIIVPVYNEEKFLSDCIESIRNQTYKNIEIILVDDGSTNSAGAICDYQKSIDERIIVIHKKNEGLSMARTDGLKIAKGDWIMFVDNDDLISPFMIEDLLNANQGRAQIIAGKRLDLESTNDFKWTRNRNKNDHPRFISGIDAVEKIPNDKQETIITPMWGKLYSRDFLNGFDIYQYKEICKTIFFEDVLMTPIIYSKAETICFVDEIFYIHRELKTSISRSGKLSSFYYEQIESGNILLRYVQNMKLKNYYSYELMIYYRTIMRIWCLIDDQPIEKNICQKYKNSIVIYYYNFWKDYFLKGNEKFYIKILFYIFRFHKSSWAKVVRKLYFKK